MRRDAARVVRLGLLDAVAADWITFLLLMQKATRPAPNPTVLHGRRLPITASVVVGLERQDYQLSGTLRTSWDERDVTALPIGEHYYFERKSGALLEGDQGALLGKLAKTLSALANSGGGHILLGVADDGTIDGVPPSVGRTSTRDWLEQKLLVSLTMPYPTFGSTR